MEIQSSNIIDYSSFCIYQIQSFIGLFCVTTPTHTHNSQKAWRDFAGKKLRVAGSIWPDSHNTPKSWMENSALETRDEHQLHLLILLLSKSGHVIYYRPLAIVQILRGFLWVSLLFSPCQCGIMRQNKSPWEEKEIQTWKMPATLIVSVSGKWVVKLVRQDGRKEKNGRWDLLCEVKSRKSQPQQFSTGKGRKEEYFRVYFFVYVRKEEGLSSFLFFHPPPQQKPPSQFPMWFLWTHTHLHSNLSSDFNSDNFRLRKVYCIKYK